MTYATQEKRQPPLNTQLYNYRNMLRTMRENHDISLADSIFHVILMNSLNLSNHFVNASRYIFYAFAARTSTSAAQTLMGT